MVKLNNINIYDIGNTIQIAGAVYTGNGKSYICLFPHEDLEEIEQLDMDLQEWETFLRQTDLVEVEMIGGDKLKKVILRKTQRMIDQNVMWEVYRRDNYACRYCGNNKCPLTVDHLILWEAGGPSTVDNLVAACKKCNKKRGNMKYEDWLDSEYYTKVSGGIGAMGRAENLALVSKLANVQLVKNIRSR